jgi:hypothetical protein
VWQIFKGLFSHRLVASAGSGVDGISERKTVFSGEQGVGEKEPCQDFFSSIRGPVAMMGEALISSADIRLTTLSNELKIMSCSQSLILEN